MRVIICLLYNVTSIFWFYAPNTRAFDGFNIITLLLLFALSLFNWEYPKSICAKLIISYTIGTLIARGIYTTMCVYQKKGWVYEHTDYFTGAFTFSFAIVIFISILLYIKKAYDVRRFY